MASTTSLGPAMAICSGASCATWSTSERAHAELAERIGEVDRDREDAARAEDVDRSRASASMSIARSIRRGSALARRRSIETAAEWVKPSSSGRRQGPAAVGRAQQGDALAIVREALAQPGAEHLLQIGKALIVERLGEAHERRGLHAGAARDRRGGAERDLVRMLGQKGGDLPQPLRQECRRAPRAARQKAS